MHRMREHIHRLHLDRAVPAVLEHAQVARERRRVARDVHHTLRTHVRNRVEQRLFAPLARRVHHDDVGGYALRLPLRDDPLGLARDEDGVAHAVQLRIPLRVCNRLRHNFNAVHPPRLLGEEQADGPDATIRIDDRFLAL